MEYYVTQSKDYWIAPTAVNITLNALSEKNRIQGSVASGAVIMCFIEDIKAESAGGEPGNGDGLWYGANHEPKRWQLSLSPTFFNSETHKYVYAAIPRSTSVGSQAIIVFPSEELDIYGRARRIQGENESYEQVGSTDFFYVYLHGIIGAPQLNPETNREERDWEIPITDWGKLSTAQGIEEKLNSSEWYNYSQATQIVTFLKEIIMREGSSFRNLILNSKNLNDVATSMAVTHIDSDTMVATPNYISKFYLSKVADDVAAGHITFRQGVSIIGSAILSNDIKSEGFVDGLYNGRGWRIDSLGNAEVESLRVRTMLEVVELLINRMQAQEGDTLFSDNDQIEEVEPVYVSVTPSGNENPQQQGWYERLIVEPEDQGSEDSEGLEPEGQGSEDSEEPIGPQEEEYVYVKTTDTSVVSGKDYYRIGSYILTFKEKWDGYITAQQRGNILKGIVNTLAAKEAGVSDVEANTPGQESDGKNKYYTSWMRVMETHDEVEALGVNQVRVTLYGDVDEHDNPIVPSGKNFAPCKTMNVARWGCFLDPSEPGISSAEKASRERRQRLIYISNSDGRITKLTGVNKPILEEWNYGTTLGTLPDFVKEWNIGSRLIDGRDYLYAQGVVVGDFIKVDSVGKPITEYVDCGEWVDGANMPINPQTGNRIIPSPGYGIYYKDEHNDTTMRWETHDVWHNGQKWRCNVHQPVIDDDGIHYNEPKWNSDDWTLIEGDSEYFLDFQSSNGWSFRGGHVNTSITPVIYFGSTDISADFLDDSLWCWKRCEEVNWNDGNPSYTSADEAWNALHENTRVLALSNSDMTASWSRSNRMFFICECTINDGKNTIYVNNLIKA